jgi:hypothetical protein
LAVDGLRLQPVSSAWRAQCHSLAIVVRSRFPVLCPSRLPRTSQGKSPSADTYWPGYDPRPSSTSARHARYFSIGTGYGHPPDAGTTARLFTRGFHLVLFEGDVPRDWLETDPSLKFPQRRVGARTLGGKHGKLYRQLSFGRSFSELGGHSTFVWKEHGVVYAVSLHGPDARFTLDVLSAIVATLRPVS